MSDVPEPGIPDSREPLGPAPNPPTDPLQTPPVQPGEQECGESRGAGDGTYAAGMDGTGIGATDMGATGSLPARVSDGQEALAGEPPAPPIEPPTPAIEPPTPAIEPPTPVIEPPARHFEPPAGRIEPPAAPIEPPDPSMPEIEREVADAMSQMSSADLAELGGDTGGGEPDPSALEPGDELTGTVAGFSDEDIFLQFGVKLQGVVPRSHFGKKELIEAGRRVDIVVERYDRNNDLLMCARKGAAQRATWTNLSTGMLVDGRVTGMNKGGLEVDLKGIRAFLPASHVDIGHLKDISVLIGESVRCEVLEVDRRAKNVLVSRRKVLEKERAEASAKLLEELVEGQICKGVVGNLTEFGAFVDLGGVDGLLHISDLKWTSVDKVSDVVTPGQTVEVKVLRIDRERDRISLGLKQVTPDPWQGVEEKYPVGTPLKARIMRVAGFGAFAELEEGVDGLIPVSEMSWGRIIRTADAVSVGNMVDVVVIRVEPGKRRIALSMKQATPDPWAEALAGFEPGMLVKGKATRLTDFGVFVELIPGVEGLIHISELSDQRVRACSDVVEVGQEVETRVLGVDPEKRRIALSIKAVAQAPAEQLEAPADRPQPPRRRKKPLRGGLSSDWDW